MKWSLTTFIDALCLFLASILIGVMLSFSAHAQTQLSQIDAVQTLINTDVQEQIKDVNKRFDSLMQEMDRVEDNLSMTQGLGVGIGAAITFLQLLGFFKRKDIE